MSAEGAVSAGSVGPVDSVDSVDSTASVGAIDSADAVDSAGRTAIDAVSAGGVSTDGASAKAGPAGSRDVAAVELDRARGEIERIDRALVTLIAERVQLARRVGLAKRALELPTLDPAREAAVVRRAGELAREAGLEDEDVRYIFWHLIGLSRRAQLQES